MGSAKASRGIKICCGVAAIFIVIVAIVFLILALTVFKPKNPEIVVYPLGLEDIGLGLRGILNASAINATVSMVIAVNNRNYGSFKFKNTTGFINYRGDIVATVPIQQSLVPARGKLNISTVADFMVDRLVSNATFWSDVLAGSVNFSSDATVHGKVTMFNALKIHASVPSKCDISIFIRSRTVQSICKTKIKL
ncbi:putative Melanoma inhibitory activity protein 3 [Hibiscus syriacus]|uniref:Melanoma inhibitory activity protein 3 n=1 Tax=Hibiscus syriacus TaxID=106335 RepID=A0A6A2X5Q4_HIBSY|nr:uncharacterized protein LOC120193411 [Hibiscus syriacus]KAE8657386.1 putative Melanoma inhibitory activity protein 3 [Hibiscus syriacus]